MKPIDYFKLQSKNLFKDFQTQSPRFDEILDGNHNVYNPKYFDIVGIILHFDFDEDKFTLMRAQHIIAQLAGFVKWTDMLEASEIELELAKLLFDNQHKISYEEWKHYLMGAEYDNDMTFDPETRLDIFKTVFANEEGHETQFQDFRINPILRSTVN